LSLTGKVNCRTICVHLVFVTKYLQNALTLEMLDKLSIIFKETCEQLHCELLEFGGEDFHVHLMVSAHPKIAFSNLLVNLKANLLICLENHFGRKSNPNYGEITFGHQAIVLSL